jgi:putative protein kinase ArgK-like GTPase of G3E family
MRTWLREEISASFIDALEADTEVKKRLPEIEQRVVAGTLTPAAAARGLVASFVERDPEAHASFAAHADRRARR